jgi:hypothetical protein
LIDGKRFDAVINDDAYAMMMQHTHTHTHMLSLSFVVFIYFSILTSQPFLTHQNGTHFKEEKQTQK